jgi:hypothetical protein
MKTMESDITPYKTNVANLKTDIKAIKDHSKATDKLLHAIKDQFLDTNKKWTR